MRVYLVRHGASELNLVGVHQKATTPLAQSGKKQAKILARHFQKIPIDIIYSSPLLRAKQTAEVLSEALKIPVEYMQELQERRRASSMQGKKPGREISEEIYKLLRKHRYSPDWRYEDAETFNELKQRVQRSIKHLEKYHENQNVLLVTHGIFMRMFLLSTFFGEKMTPKQFYTISDKLITHNTGITVFDYSKGEGWTLVSWNEVAHLGNIKTKKLPELVAEALKL